MRGPSSGDIEKKLAGHDALVRELSSEFDLLSSDVVAGVEGAGKRAVEIDQRLGRLATDRRVLVRALDRAVDAEVASAAKADAERRQGHREQARLNALALVECADRMDGLADDLTAAVAEIREKWHSVRTSLRQAGDQVESSNFGQADPSLHVLSRLSIIQSGIKFDRTERRAGHWVRIGWRDLIEGGGDG